MNLPFHRVHDVFASYGRLLLPIPFSGGRWLMISDKRRFRVTSSYGFHNCTRTGIR